MVVVVVRLLPLFLAIRVLDLKVSVSASCRDLITRYVHVFGLVVVGDLDDVPLSRLPFFEVDLDRGEHFVFSFPLFLLPRLAFDL